MAFTLLNGAFGLECVVGLRRFIIHNLWVLTAQLTWPGPGAMVVSMIICFLGALPNTDVGCGEVFSIQNTFVQRV